MHENLKNRRWLLEAVKRKNSNSSEHPNRETITRRASDQRSKNENSSMSNPALYGLRFNALYALRAL